MTYDPAELLSYEVSSDGRGEGAWLPPPSMAPMVPIYTQTAHSSERVIGGQERRISVGETPEGSHKSAFSEEDKVETREGDGVISLVQKFIHYCPPPSPRLKPVSSITQIIYADPRELGDLISLYVF